MRIHSADNRIIITNGPQTLWLEPWGKDSLRVRMTADPRMDENDWALTEKVPYCQATITVEERDTTDPWYASEEYAHYHQTGKFYTLTNGKITAKINPEGWIS